MHQEIPQDDRIAQAAPISPIRALLYEAHQRAEVERLAFVELELQLTMRLRALRVFSAICHSLFATVDGKIIDDRECAPLDVTDTDWGEQDDLSNVPRKADRCA